MPLKVFFVIAGTIIGSTLFVLALQGIDTLFFK
jgi:hypothetical protein